MKYIEELAPGDCFDLDGKFYLLTSDFKSNGDKLCYSLECGHSKWIKSNDIVNILPIYKLDEDNSIVAIKPTLKTTNE